MIYVAVIGPGEEARPVDIRRAEAVGALLPVDAVVVTGGLGGVMSAVAHGFPGTSIGFLPGGSRANASEHLTYTFPTDIDQLRNGLVVRAANAVIAIGGSWGTLSEVALARRLSIPVVSLDGWRITDSEGRDADLVRVDTPAAAIDEMMRMLAE